MRPPVTASVLFVLVFSATGTALAQGPAPTLTVSGQTAAFATPVAILNAVTSRVSLLFPAAPLAADVEAAARAKGSWEGVAGGVAPAVIADLDFTPGSTSGMVEQMKACRLQAVGFKTAWKVAGGAAECHVVSVGGLLRSSGGIAGLLEGKGPGYSLRLPFAVSLMEAATTTTAAAQAAPAPSAAGPTSTVPANTVTGVVTYMGQKLTLTHGIAWWADTQRQVRVALFDHPPAAGMLADLRKGETGEGGPMVDFYVHFKDGGAHDVTAVDYCYVNASFPKGGPMGTNSNAKGCGLELVATDARPGGVVSVIARAKARGPAADFTWDLTFNLPIAK